MPDKDEGTIVVNAALENRQVHSRFDFDSSFNANTSQEEVFRKVQPFVISKYSFASIGACMSLVRFLTFYRNAYIIHICYTLYIGAMDGFNCCIFAYGQTGSGKTFTMEGPVTNRGVNVRALHAMFEEGHARRKSLGMAFTFSVTMCEIYREDVYDLLQEGKSENGIRQKITLRQGKKGVFADGLHSVVVESAEDVEKLVKREIETVALELTISTSIAVVVTWW